MSLTKFVGLLAGSTLTLTSVSYGATEANNDTATQLSELKAEIAALKAQQGEQWLTEQRAAQVRGIVQDVLADADTRASLQNTAATSGYDNGFFISSADGNFKLKITALEQVRFVYNNNRPGATNPDTRENVWGFENRRTQMWFTGNVVDQSWTYAIGLTIQSETDPYYQTPAPGGVGVGYAYLRKSWKNADSNLYVQAGQFSAPWTLESNLWSAGNTQMGEFSAFEYVFGVGLTTGLLVGWENDFLSIKGSASNGFDQYGYTGGAGTGTPTWWNFANAGTALAARADIKLGGTWDQFSNESSFRGEEFGAKIGASLIWATPRNTTNPAGGSDPFGLNVDAMLDFGGANLIGQFAYVDDNAAAAGGSTGDTWGINLQGGFFLTDDLEAFGSWNFFSADAVAAPGRNDASLITIGGNWYIAKNNCKITTAVLFPLLNDSFGGGNAGGLNFPGMGLSGGGANNISIVCQLQVSF